AGSTGSVAESGGAEQVRTLRPRSAAATTALSAGCLQGREKPLLLDLRSAPPRGGADHQPWGLRRSPEGGMAGCSPGRNEEPYRPGFLSAVLRLLRALHRPR